MLVEFRYILSKIKKKKKVGKYGVKLTKIFRKTYQNFE